MYARYCTSCPCVESCRAAFGAYWFDKSSKGVGCNNPFDGKKDIIIPPPVRPEMTRDEEWAWFEEYDRRVNEAIAKFKDWTPQELDVAVCLKYPGRFKRRYP